MGSRYFNMFTPQSFSEEEEYTATCNNMAVDLLFSHKALLEEFVAHNPIYRGHFDWLVGLKYTELEAAVAKARAKSVLMTVVMLTGECNADCAICYTDRRKKAKELTADEVRQVMDQTFRLGSRLLYIPGEGEPTLEAGIFDILDHAREIGMHVILFTNGILLSNDEQARSRWGMSAEEFVRRLSQYPVYIYHKLWSTWPELVAEMMRIPMSCYKYTPVEIAGRTVNVPSGLPLLLRHFPKERVGVETVVEQRNYQEVSDVIIPLVKQLGIKSYIEPIIHAGRCFGNFQYDPPATALQQLSPWLARQNCRRVAYKVVVHSDGTVSYGMAVKGSLFGPKNAASEEMNVRATHGGVKDLVTLIHTNPLLVWGRYQVSGCICEELNVRAATGRSCMSDAASQATATV